VTGLPTTGAAADRGEADVLLATALAVFGQDGDANPVVSLLSTARLLVPVVATAPGPGEGDRDTEISAVLMRGRDGRLALLAFTCLDSLRLWNPQARPVPVVGRDAARAAQGQDAEALLIDLAGPVPFVVETPALTQLAAGHQLRRTTLGYAWFVNL
jgi:SseB protein N-terminal domain